MMRRRADVTRMAQAVARYCGLRGQVAGRALRRYGAGATLLVEVALVVGYFALSFGAPFGTVYFFESAGVGLSVLSVVGALLMGQRAASLRFVVLASLRASGRHGRRRNGRASVVGALLAVCVIRLGALALLVGLALVFRRFTDLSARTLLEGSLGVGSVTLLVAVMTMVIAAPLTHRVAQLGVLAWLVAALASYSVTDGALGAALALARLPLWPIARCYGFVVDGVGWAGVGALALVGAGGVALAALNDAALMRRLRADGALRVKEG